MTNGHAADFQRRVATIALVACREQGFALAGGQALIAHGIVNRATEDIDIFTNDLERVRPGQTVTAALIVAGYDEHIVRVQLARFDRHRAPVVMDISPVLHVDDVLGSKVAPSRHEPNHATTSTSPPRCEYAPPTSYDGSPGRPTQRSATTSYGQR